MTKTIAAALVVTGVITMNASPARAQAPPAKKIYIDLNFGTQPTSGSFTTSGAPIVYGETAPYDAVQPYSGAEFIDISGGFRAWRDLSVGLAVTTTFPTKDTAGVTVGVPSPVFFDRRIQQTITLEDLERKEQSAHLVIKWTSPVTDKIEASILGGPSYIKLYQELVQGIEVAPGTQDATATAAEQTATVLGFHIGGDLSYLISPNVGVGGLVRYVKGTVDLPAVADVKVGGIQLGGGLRIRF